MTIYLDNAATTWPKPPEVMSAINHFNETIGSNPGRSGHQLSVEAGRTLFNTRLLISELFNISDPLRIAFTSNVTHSLNIVIHGLLKPGDHVITTSIEHNSVMRPIRNLENDGLSVTVVQCRNDGTLDPGLIDKSVTARTKLIITTHASNVTGTILPVSEIGKISKNHGIPYCVDSAQTAGVLDIDVEESNIDILCFTGHKGLFGPMGTGGLYIKKGLESKITPLMFGGTGSRSEFELQPEFMPDRYESGTLNALGIAGLGGGLEFIKRTGTAAIHSKENILMGRFIDGISEIKGLRLYGPADTSSRVAVIPFNIEGHSPSDISFALDEKYSIMTRPGLHCAPSAHKTIDTFPVGTNRISFGFFNTEEDVDITIKALREISSL